MGRVRQRAGSVRVPPSQQSLVSSSAAAVSWLLQPMHRGIQILVFQLNDRLTRAGEQPLFNLPESYS